MILNCFETMGERLGISEEAAKERVFRAVERLRGIFARRGVMLPSGTALGVLILAQGVRAAPSALTGALVAAAASPGVTSAAMAQAAIRAMGLAKVKLAAIYLAIVAVFGGGAGVIVHQFQGRESYAVALTPLGRPGAIKPVRDVVTKAIASSDEFIKVLPAVDAREADSPVKLVPMKLVEVPRLIPGTTRRRNSI